ncbi:copper resistance protein NlpE [Gracilimonas amylolytica]|uniref:copper resistance protein NlpE n=1 Tax=Gracilimonas amylolytica TaxID=1749045 RepID=UPI000CD7ECF1|nr:copper resistance protein NlpE [Gracilimonas amylolytica]
MKTLILILISLMLIGCVQKNQSNDPEVPQAIPDDHTSQNALDWYGSYSGLLPCASCEGIKTTLVLNANGSYSLTLNYLGESEPNTFETQGSFSWNEAGNTITLENKEAPNQYYVGENYIAKLDMEGNRVTGDLANMYILQKD